MTQFVSSWQTMYLSINPVAAAMSLRQCTSFQSTAKC